MVNDNELAASPPAVKVYCRSGESGAWVASPANVSKGLLQRVRKLKLGKVRATLKFQYILVCMEEI